MIISKLNAACFAIKTVTSLFSGEDLRILYFSCVHSIVTYGVICYVHMREMGLCFDIIILCLYYICIMTSSISYRLVDLVWIDRIHNK